MTWRFTGALGGTRTPNLLIRSQMLYPLSYERTNQQYTAARLLTGTCLRRPASSTAGLFRLDPAGQLLSADRFQQGRMVGGQVPSDHPDHLVIAIAAGYEPAFASDQLHPCAS